MVYRNPGEEVFPLLGEGRFQLEISNRIQNLMEFQTVRLSIQFPVGYYNRIGRESQCPAPWASLQRLAQDKPCSQCEAPQREARRSPGPGKCPKERVLVFGCAFPHVSAIPGGRHPLLES